MVEGRFDQILFCLALGVSSIGAGDTYHLDSALRTCSEPPALRTRSGPFSRPDALRAFRALVDPRTSPPSSSGR
ncbi:hypothetical protein B0H19DRAFT_426856 [Mycena capillaripes]|nr:hypothetical protein B0H19DRAFT_426856 [Mycena capillaripes]